MQRLLFAMIAMLALSTAGCTVSDALFCALGEFYTDGGTTLEEKKHHYDTRLGTYD